MRILLCAPVFSEGCTGLLVLKALGELGHGVVVWDYRVSDKPPDVSYDLALVWNGFFNPEVLKRPRVLFFLDDTNFASVFRIMLRKVSNLYDGVFSVNKLDSSFNAVWTPVGCDLDVHKVLPIINNKNPVVPVDVVFIGTCRDVHRRVFVNALQSELEKEGITMKVYGNNWDFLTKPAYFSQFSQVCASSKIVVNQHYSNIGPSTKVHEICCVGGGLLISDYNEGVKHCYPMVPNFSNLEECIRLIKYYLKNQKKRQHLVKQLQKQSHKYTYKKQLQKILKQFK